MLSAWLPPLLWLAVILFASGDAFSAERTGAVLRALLAFFFGDVEPGTLAAVHHALRKTGHVVGYFVLSWLVFRALRQGHAEPRPAWKARWALLAILFSVATALLDESRQSLLSSRSGQFSDVLLNSAGAVTAQIFLFVLSRLRARSRSPALSA